MVGYSSVNKVCFDFRVWLIDDMFFQDSSFGTTPSEAEKLAVSAKKKFVLSISFQVYLPFIYEQNLNKEIV